MEKAEVAQIVSSVLERYRGMAENREKEAPEKELQEKELRGKELREKESAKNPETDPGTHPGEIPGGQAAREVGSVTLDFAEALMKKVEDKAREMGMRVVTAVADAAGRPVAVHCMDGAYMGSYDVALNKTFTAVAFQMSTEELGKLSQPGGPLYGIQFTNQGKIVIFGGGVPLRLNGKLIGAFGVSGGSAEQDTYLAHFAEDAFLEMTGQK